MLKTTLEPAERRNLAALALELAQEAEAIASLPDDAEGLRVRVAQYRQMLDRADNQAKPRIFVQLLREAEGKLQRINRQRLPGSHRVAMG